MKPLRLTEVHVFRFRATHTIDEDHGPDGTPLLHGHDYDLEVHLHKKDHTPSRSTIHRIINSHIIARHDKAHLNELYEPATGENLCLQLLNLLKKTELGAYIKKIVLNETRKNSFITLED